MPPKKRPPTKQNVIKATDKGTTAPPSVMPDLNVCHASLAPNKNVAARIPMFN
jgi:hypothetical protein